MNIQRRDFIEIFFAYFCCVYGQLRLFLESTEYFLSATMQFLSLNYHKVTLESQTDILEIVHIFLPASIRMHSLIHKIYYPFEAQIFCIEYQNFLDCIVQEMTSSLFFLMLCKLDTDSR